MYRSKKEIIFANEISKHFGLFETNPKRVFGTPDLYFKECKLAVFFNGCFWHSHHCQTKQLSDVWTEKLSKIADNDRHVIQQLAKEDVASLTIWECHWDQNPQREMGRLFDYQNLLLNYIIRLRNKASKSSSAIVE